jgi:hypothetical protein
LAKLRTWFTPRFFAIAVLAFFALVPFVQPLVRGEVINSGDVRTLYMPYFLEVRQQLAAGELPVWYRGASLGMPLTTLVDAVAIYYPVTQLLLRLPDPFRAFMLDYPLHFFLAGLAMFAYLRVVGVARWPALAGALVMMLSGYMFHRLIHPSQLRPVAYFPAVLLCLELAVRRSGIYYLAAGVVFGLLILGSHPQPIVYTVLAAGAYVAWRAWDAPHRSLFSRLARGAAGLALAGGLGLALGAVQWLPMLEMFPYSERSAANTASFFGSSALDLRNLPLLVFPLLYGQPDAGTFWGSQYDHGALYVGVLPLVFLPFVLRTRRQRIALFFAGLAALGLLAALGTATPLGQLLFHVPVINAFRAPMRFLMFYVMGMATLAALGLEVAAEWPHRAPRDRFPAKLAGLAALVCLAGAAGLWRTGPLMHKWLLGMVGAMYARQGWASQLMSIDHPDRAAYHLGQLVHAPDTLRQSLVLLGTLLAACAALFALRHRLGPSRFALTAALVASLDLLAVGLHNAPLHTLPASYFRDPPATVQKLPTGVAPYRLLSWDGGVFRNGPSPYSAEVYGVGQVGVHWWDGDADQALYFREREMLPPVMGLAFGVESFNAYGGLRPQQWQALRDLFDDTADPARIGHRQLLDMLNIRYVASSLPLNDEGLRLVEAGEVYLYENLSALPRAYLVRNWTVVQDEAAALEALREPTFDPASQAVILDDEPVPDPTPWTGVAEHADSVELFEDRPGALSYQVTTDTPSLLVVSNWQYPGWQARVGGQPAKIVRVNYLMQGIYLAAGENTVALAYQPASLRQGATITLATLLVLGLAAGSVVLRPLALPRRVKKAAGYGSPG